MSLPQRMEDRNVDRLGAGGGRLALSGRDEAQAKIDNGTHMDRRSNGGGAEARRSATISVGWGCALAGVALLVVGPAGLVVVALAAAVLAQAAAPRQADTPTPDTATGMVGRLRHVWTRSMNGSAMSAAFLAPIAYVAYAAIVGAAAVVAPRATSAVIEATLGRLDGLVPVAAEARAWFAARHGDAIGAVFGHLAAAHAFFGLAGCAGAALVVLLRRDEALVDRIAALNPFILGFNMLLAVMIMWAWFGIYVAGFDGPWAFGTNRKDPRPSLAFPFIAALLTLGAACMCVFSAAVLRALLRAGPREGRKGG
jgi:hypothetical protein